MLDHFHKTTLNVIKIFTILDSFQNPLGNIPICLMTMTSKLLVIISQNRAELKASILLTLLSCFHLLKKSDTGRTSPNKNLLHRKSNCDLQKAVKIA